MLVVTDEDPPFPSNRSGLEIKKKVLKCFSGHTKTVVFQKSSL
jgi:hypothetical protein